MRKRIIAITGPSGVGKTTLGDLLIERNQFIYPTHTTTRNPRPDDESGFYNYLTHREFNNYVMSDGFLFWSGDSEIVSKTNGNFYGILNKDYESVELYDKIMMFISYKDILNVLDLKETGRDIDIINLIYSDLERNMIKRLVDSNRGHSVEEINARIKCAKEYEEQFRNIMSLPSILKIPTDVYDEEQTYNIVRKRLMR